MTIICAICHESLVEGPSGNSVVKALSCGHLFHGECIQKWFQSGGATSANSNFVKCPCCNKNNNLSISLRVYPLDEEDITFSTNPATQKELNELLERTAIETSLLTSKLNASSLENEALQKSMSKLKETNEVTERFLRSEIAKLRQSVGDLQKDNKTLREQLQKVQKNINTPPSTSHWESLPSHLQHKLLEKIKINSGITPPSPMIFLEGPSLVKLIEAEGTVNKLLLAQLVQAYINFKVGPALLANAIEDLSRIAMKQTDPNLENKVYKSKPYHNIPLLDDLVDSGFLQPWQGHTRGGMKRYKFVDMCTHLYFRANFICAEWPKLGNFREVLMPLKMQTSTSSVTRDIEIKTEIWEFTDTLQLYFINVHFIFELEKIPEQFNWGDVNGVLQACLHQDLYNMTDFLLDTQTVPCRILASYLAMGNLRVLKKLLTTGYIEWDMPLVAYRTEDHNFSLLHLAMKKGTRLIVQSLLEQGFASELNPVKEYMRNIVPFCVSNTTDNSDDEITNKVEILKLLYLENARLIKSPDESTVTPILCPKVHFKLIKVMDTLGADLNTSKDRDGNTVLHLAAGGTSPDQFHNIVQHLIQTRRIALLRRKNCQGFTALQLAVRSFEVMEETVKLFVDAGVDFNNEVEPITGRNLFLSAIHHQRSVNFLKILVESGVNWEEKDFRGDTALHLAVGKEDLNAIQYLLRLGADLHTMNKSGLAVFDIVFGSPFGKRREVLAMIAELGRKEPGAQ